MTIESEIAALTQATTDLLSAVNVRKTTLDEKVGNADAFAQASLTSANNAEASAATANTKAGEGAGYAAQALAIYGNTTAMQTAVAQAAAQASVAAGHAASASSVVQQDLSGVNAAALHRSPNAVTAMFVYDTSKDSDGGAWTEKCQHTSWYNEAINGKWLGAQASEAAARAVSGATTGDYFQLTTDGKFYRLNPTSGVSEVFRGNKRDFPRLAAIVAEAGNVTIYDLTEPGRPMWMRFASGSAQWFLLGWPTTSIFSMNGLLLIGCSTAGGGYGHVAVVDLAKDALARWSAAPDGYTSNYGTGGAVASRNGTLGFISHGNGPRLVSKYVNAVAMTVLPDAPVDPVTGLQVPTIAVATVGGVSVIKHNGMVVNSQGTSIISVSIGAEGIFAQHTTTEPLQYIGNPGALAGSFTLTASSPNWTFGGGGFIRRKSRANMLRVATSSNLIQSLKNHETTAARGITSKITNTFNTGYMPGDIRRAYLADVDAGSVSGTELVTNGTFDTSSEWTLTPGLVGGESASISGGVLVLGRDSATNSYGTGIQAITTTVGKTYKIVLSTAAGTSVLGARVGTSGMSNANGDFSAVPSSSITATFVASATTTFISLFAASTGTANVDSVSVQEAVADRSYKAQGASIAGTLTKTPVALGSQLVAYSGFSS